jgi:hypothetical protein
VEVLPVAEWRRFGSPTLKSQDMLRYYSFVSHISFTPTSTIFFLRLTGLISASRIDRSDVIDERRTEGGKDQLCPRHCCYELKYSPRKVVFCLRIQYGCVIVIFSQYPDGFGPRNLLIRFILAKHVHMPYGTSFQDFLAEGPTRAMLQVCHVLYFRT